MSRRGCHTTRHDDAATQASPPSRVTVIPPRCGARTERELTKQRRARHRAAVLPPEVLARPRTMTRSSTCGAFERTKGAWLGATGRHEVPSVKVVGEVAFVRKGSGSYDEARI